MKKKLPIGWEFFDILITEGYHYVDKTLFIKELLDYGSYITVITRPRRFGKTLNLSMLSCFFDIRRDSRELFSGLKIMELEEITGKHMNKYPVIFLSLKDVAAPTYEGSMTLFANVISDLYERHSYLIESGKLSFAQTETFRKYNHKTASHVELMLSLLQLTQILYSYHKQRVVVLLDEYDAPIDNSEVSGFYGQMIEFMRGFMGSVFKSNEALKFAVITGVQRISQQGLFSKLNNPKICGIIRKEFSDCFGFTEEEVACLCTEYGAGNSMDEIKAFYDGYRFGERDMYNPWSIIMYLAEQRLGLHWVNTGSLSVLRNIFIKGSMDLREKAENLLLGIPISMRLTDHITYPIDYSDSNLFWTMLYNAGYIKHLNGASDEDDRFYAELVNEEVRAAFRLCINDWLQSREGGLSDGIEEFIGALQKGDAPGMQKALNNKLLISPSYHDMINENSYHMFTLGILQVLGGKYVIRSNREEGEGRADCVLRPKDKNMPSLIIEFKHVKEDKAGDADAKIEDIRKAARAALRHIKSRGYTAELTDEGYGTVYKYGIAFNGKYCIVEPEI